MDPCFTIYYIFIFILKLGSSYIVENRIYGLPHRTTIFGEPSRTSSLPGWVLGVLLVGHPFHLRANQSLFHTF